MGYAENIEAMIMNYVIIVTHSNQITPNLGSLQVHHFVTDE